MSARVFWESGKVTM